MPIDDHTRSTPRTPRVLLANDRLGYGNQRLHGAGRLMVDWTRALVDRGVEVTTVILREPGALGRRMLDEGLPFVFLGRSPYDPRTVLDLVRLGRQRQIEVMHLQAFGASFFGRLAGAWLGVPTLVHVHADYRVEPKGYPWFVRLLDRRLAPGTAGVVAISEAVAGFARDEQGFRPEQVQVRHNPVDAGHFRPPADEERRQARADLEVDGESPVVVCVARFDRVKGVDTLLEAWRSAVDGAAPGTLLLVGEGPDGAALRRQVGTLLHPQRVRFVGYRDDVRTALWAADLAVVPSRMEGLSLAALEAMGTGLPVVAFEVGGLPEFVDDGTNGCLVPAGDARAMGTALAALMSDASRRLRLSAAARRTAVEHDLSAFTAELEQLYRDLAAPQPSA